MSKPGRCTLTILAVSVLSVIGCTNPAADSAPVVEPIDVVQTTQDAGAPILGESDPLDAEGPDSGSGQGTGDEEPGEAAGQPHAGTDLEEVLKQLNRIEEAQRQMHSGLHLLSFDELDLDLRRRVEEAQKQLRAAQAEVAGLPNGAGLVDMLGQMRLVLSHLSEAEEPCSDPGERSESLEAAEQRLDDARKWVEESPSNANREVLLETLKAAQKELDREKTEACIGKDAS